jgi:hypothetical protein
MGDDQVGYPARPVGSFEFPPMKQLKEDYFVALAES